MVRRDVSGVVVIAGIATLAGCFAGCHVDDERAGGGASGAGSGGSVAQSAGSATVGSAGNAVSAAGAESMGGAAGSAGAAAGGAAAGSAGSAASDERPLDVLVLFDVSGSTCLNLAGDVNEPCPPQAGPMRLELMTSALSAWLDASESGGIGVGLTLFGADPIGRAVCDPAHYQTPLVAIAPLPGNVQALNTALLALEPTGETPTGAAIRGACSSAKQWRAAHPTRTTAILLMTDGEPGASASCGDGIGCCPDLQEAVEAASECNSGATPIRTYVLAIGPLLSNTNELAVAGGTTSAYHVTAENELALSLEQFRSDALSEAQK